MTYCLTVFFGLKETLGFELNTQRTMVCWYELLPLAFIWSIRKCNFPFFSGLWIILTKVLPNDLEREFSFSIHHDQQYTCKYISLFVFTYGMNQMMPFILRIDTLRFLPVRFLINGCSFLVNLAPCLFLQLDFSSLTFNIFVMHGCGLDCNPFFLHRWTRFSFWSELIYIVFRHKKLG